MEGRAQGQGEFWARAPTGRARAPGERPLPGDHECASRPAARWRCCCCSACKNNASQAKTRQKNPKRAGACGRPPNNTTAAGVPGGRWGSVVFGWRALRRHPVSVVPVFVLGFVSLIHSLTSGKTQLKLLKLIPKIFLIPQQKLLRKSFMFAPPACLQLRASSTRAPQASGVVVANAKQEPLALPGSGAGCGRAPLDRCARRNGRRPSRGRCAQRTTLRH